MTDSRDVLASLNGKSSTLFLVAGGLLVVFAANSGARAFADAGVSAVHSVFGPAGFFLGVVGLIGLYPVLAERRSTLARVAAAVAAVPLVGWFVIVVAGIGSAVGVLPGASVLLPGPAFIAIVLSTIVAYPLFSATSLRAGVHSRTVGVLLVTPAVVFLTLIVGVQATAISATAAAEFALDTGHALAHLLLGAALRTDRVPTDRTDPAADATP